MILKRLASYNLANFFNVLHSFFIHRDILVAYNPEWKMSILCINNLFKYIFYDRQHNSISNIGRLFYKHVSKIYS